MTKETIKVLIGMAIQVLGMLIPALGGLLGIPVVGWIASFAISYLSGLLYDLIARYKTFGEIDAEVAAQVNEMQQASIKLREIQKTGTAEEKAAGLDAFSAAAQKLANFKLR